MREICNRVLPAALAASVLASMASPASAAPPSAELAKKCRELMVKAYPPVPAGTAKGNAQAQRAYFQKCIANNGNMPPEEQQGQ